MTGASLYWKCWNNLLLEFYSIGYAKIKNGRDFKSLEMLKYDTTGVLYCSKRKNKVRLGIYFVESAEIMYCWGFKWNIADRKLLRFFERGQLLLVHSLILIKWAFFTKICNFNLFHRKGQSKIGFAISFIEHDEIR